MFKEEDIKELRKGLNRSSWRERRDLPAGRTPDPVMMMMILINPSLEYTMGIEMGLVYTTCTCSL